MTAEGGADHSLFHYDLLGGGCILICIHVGLRRHALLHDCFAQGPSAVTRRVARGVHKAKDSGAYISFGGESDIILHMAE